MPRLETLLGQSLLRLWDSLRASTWELIRNADTQALPSPGTREAWHLCCNEPAGAPSWGSHAGTGVQEASPDEMETLAMMDKEVTASQGCGGSQKLPQKEN